MFNNLTVILVVCFYFMILMVLGVKGYRKTKTFSDYILGSRKVGPILGAMNVGASDMSSWLLMGLPGAFYLYGMNQIWMVIGLIIGSYSCWKIIAKRLRVYTEIANDSLTVSSFLEHRYNDTSKILRVITAAIIIFFFTIYIASGFVGSAKLFAEFFNLNYISALLISAIAVVLYAFLGGFLAVSWADLLQGLLMLFALIITPIAIIFKTGDFSSTISSIKATSPQHLNIFYDTSIVGIISALAWGLGYFGQPHIISKFMAIEKISYIKTSTRICITWMIMASLGAVLVGLIGYQYFIGRSLERHETVFIVASAEIFPPIIVGVLIAAILAAIMSTINSQVLICCSALAEDFYKRFFRKDAEDKELLIATRISVAIITIIAVLVATDENLTILGLVAHAWAGLGASIGPIIIMSLFWKKTTKLGAIAGVISGGLGAIFFSIYFTDSIFSYELFPAFVLSLICIVIFSLIDKNGPPKNAEAELELVKQKISQG